MNFRRFDIVLRLVPGRRGANGSTSKDKVRVSVEFTLLHGDFRSQIWKYISRLLVNIRIHKGSIGPVNSTCSHHTQRFFNIRDSTCLICPDYRSLLTWSSLVSPLSTQMKRSRWLDWSQRMCRGDASTCRHIISIWSMLVTWLWLSHFLLNPRLSILQLRQHATPWRWFWLLYLSKLRWIWF